MKFLLKVVFFAALVVAVFLVISSKKIRLPSSVQKLADPQALQHLTQTQLSGLGSQLSSALDGLVTHNRTSPVVLGLQVTNTSLNSIVDVIQRLPPDQINELKQTICSPATSSAQK